MQITFVTDTGENFSVEIDPDMKLQDVQALLEAEVSHSPHLVNPLFIRCATRDTVRRSYTRASHLTRRTRAQPAIGDDEGARCVR